MGCKACITQSVQWLLLCRETIRQVLFAAAISLYAHAYTVFVLPALHTHANTKRACPTCSYLTLSQFHLNINPPRRRYDNQ
jgi:hypothetical protein